VSREILWQVLGTLFKHLPYAKLVLMPEILPKLPACYCVHGAWGVLVRVRGLACFLLVCICHVIRKGDKKLGSGAAGASQEEEAADASSDGDGDDPEQLPAETAQIGSAGVVHASVKKRRIELNASKMDLRKSVSGSCLTEDFSAPPSLHLFLILERIQMSFGFDGLLCFSFLPARLI
jgi:hypothetical protein